MKIRIDASAEERIDKAVKRAEEASLAAEARAEQMKYMR